ncbi:MAG: MBL fold metallo-hydrolase [Blastochloris sp.]|nr:MBL fold metallo-hydrolase [Blastochloris sp.]
MRRACSFIARATLTRLAELLARDTAPHTLFDDSVQQALNLRLHSLEPWQPFLVGSYQVIAFPAAHDPSVEPLLYAITQGAQTIFYGTDTARLPESVWQAFHAMGLRFDVVILDHTYGPDHPGDDHLNARDVAEYAARMRAEGLLAPQGQVLATHLSHDGTPPHPAMQSYAQAHGYDVAYDGLSVALGRDPGR